MKTIRFVRPGAITAAAILALAGSASAQWSVPFEVVIKDSDPVPGVSGPVTGAAWAASNFWSLGGIDQSGNVAFLGKLAVGGPIHGTDATVGANQNAYYYGGPASSANPVKPFASDGQSGPTLPGASGFWEDTSAGAAGLNINGGPGITGNGTMAVNSSLMGTGADSNSTGIWTGPASGMTAVAVRTTAAVAAPGTVHGNFLSNFKNTFPPTTVNSSGQTFYFGTLVSDGDASSDVVAGASGTSNDSGLWIAGPSGMTMVAREGPSATLNSLVGAGAVLTDFSTLGSGASMNSSGQVVFTQNLRAGFGGVSGTATNNLGRTDAAIWSNATAGGGLALVARKGDAVPSLPGFNYASSNSTAFALSSQAFNSSGRLVYTASMSNASTSTTGFVSGNANGALMTWKNGSAQCVFQSTTAAPGVANATLNDFNITNPQYKLNNNNTLVFAASMLGTGVDATNNTGMWKTTLDSNGLPTNSQLIAQQGQVIPGLSGVTLGNLGAPNMILNNADQVVWAGSLTGSDTFHDAVLMAWDPVKGLTSLLREGDSAASLGLSGVFGTLNGVANPFTIVNSGTGDGGASGLTDNGWLTVLVTTNDGTTAHQTIIRTQIPAPGAAPLLAMGGLLAARRRRR
jgi:hypothetical protein